MKNKYILSLCAVALILCQGCADFLAEKNPVGRNDIYLTENDLEAAVEGVFAGFSYGNGVTGESNEAFPIASGLVHWGKSSSRLNSNKWLSALKFVQYASVDKLSNIQAGPIPVTSPIIVGVSTIFSIICSMANTAAIQSNITQNGRPVSAA